MCSDFRHFCLFEVIWYRTEGDCLKSKHVRISDVYWITNVNDVSLLVDHDISVVSVLDLQQVAHHRVSRHRLDEIFASRLESLGRLITVLVLEVGVQALVGLATDLKINKLCKKLSNFD